MASKPRPHRNIIGRRLRDARRSLQPPVTQDQLSGKLASIGVQLDRATIAKIEGGLRSVLDFEVKALATVLQVDVVWLLGMEPVRRRRR